MSQARNNVCAQFRSPSFASTVMLRLPFWEYNVLYPPPPPHLTTPLVPHEIVFDMTSNQNNVRASVSLSVR